MINQKKFGLNNILLAIAVILPILYFGYIIIISSQDNNLIPQYNFLYVTNSDKQDCGYQPYIKDPNSPNQEIPTNQTLQKFIITNNKIAIVDTKDPFGADYQNRICGNTFYFYDVTNNISKKLNPENLQDYTLVSNNLEYNSELKDPDGFLFKEDYNNAGASFFFSRNYDYNSPKYILTKKFTNRQLKIEGGKIRIISFINK